VNKVLLVFCINVLLESEDEDEQCAAAQMFFWKAIVQREERTRVRINRCAFITKEAALFISAFESE